MNNNVIAFLEIRFGKFLCALLTIFDRVICAFTSPAPQAATRRVVFVKFIEQGALVLHLNTFREAARKYGKENIFLVTFESNAPLMEVLDAFNLANCFYLSEKNIPSFSYSFFDAIRKLRKNQVDSLIDLEFFSCASAIFSYLAGAKKRVGYHRYDGGQNYRGDLFTHRLSYSHYLSVGDTSWSMLDCLSNPVSDLPAMQPLTAPVLDRLLFIPTDSDIDGLTKFFTAKTPYIIVNPSFRDVLPLRAWPISFYQKYVEQILKQSEKYTIVFTGKPSEHEDTEAFIKKISGIKAINLCGKTTLRELFALYSQASLLLTSDSGPGHFASLTSVPTIVLFGPETPLLYAPKAANIYVLYKSLPCSPCYNVYNNRISACKNNLCLKAIPVDEVVALSTKIIKD